MLVAPVRARQPVGEPQVAGARLREQQRAERLVALGVVRQPDVAAEDRLDAARARRLVELDEAEGVGEIGDRERGHGVRRRRRDAVVDAHRAVDDRELAVQAQVDEVGRGHGRMRKGARILLRSPSVVPLLEPPPVCCMAHARAARCAAGRARGRGRRLRAGGDGAAGRSAASGHRASRRRRPSTCPAFPLPYRQGYADGCASATGPERKDAARFGADGNYRTGWQDGLALCRRK